MAAPATVPLPSTGARVLALGIAAPACIRVANFLREAGYRGEGFCVEDSAEGDEAFATLLKSDKWDAISIGGGINAFNLSMERTPKLMLFFERILNLIHQHAVGAKIVLVALPDDLLPAFKRALGDGAAKPSS